MLKCICLFHFDACDWLCGSNVKVIGKLSEGRASHVPYRDSKLTRLLQSSLSGHGHVSVSLRYKIFVLFYGQHVTEILLCCWRSCNSPAHTSLLNDQLLLLHIELSRPLLVIIFQKCLLFTFSFPFWLFYWEVKTLQETDCTYSITLPEPNFNAS